MPGLSEIELEPPHSRNLPRAPDLS
jgi:hypothetical protein